MPKDGNERLDRPDPAGEDPSPLPEPLTGSDIDVRDLDGFYLNVERLLASELVALCTPEEGWAALMLWCRAWKQLPAGSLPNDDRILASFSRAGNRWPKIKDAALRGFVLCFDGRLYHRVLCEEAQRAFQKKKQFRERREADLKRVSEWRQKQRGNASPPANETPTDTHSDTRITTRSDMRFVLLDKGGEGRGREGEGKGRDSSEGVLGVTRRARPNPLSLPQKRGRKKRPPGPFPEDWQPNDRHSEMVCEHGLSEAWMNEQVNRCRDWHMTYGKQVKDPDAAFRTWLNKTREFEHITTPDRARSRWRCGSCRRPRHNHDTFRPC